MFDQMGVMGSIAGGIDLKDVVKARNDILARAEVPVPMPAVGYAPNVAQSPAVDNVTVGEYLRNEIVHLQDAIKQLERHYLEARQLGIVNAKVSDVRRVIGW